MSGPGNPRIATVRRLLARYLAVPDAMPVGGALPGSAEQRIDDLHRQRTLQVQVFRILAYIVPTLLFVAVMQDLVMGIFWKMAIGVTAATVLALYLLCSRSCPLPKNNLSDTGASC